MSEISHQSRKRRSSRIIRGTLTTPSGHECELLIRNVSSHGLGARTAAQINLKIGDDVIVQLPNVGRIAGTVRWIGNGGFGIETSKEIDADLLLFGGDERSLVPKTEAYNVPEAFQPTTDTRRPGFGKRRRIR